MNGFVSIIVGVKVINSPEIGFLMIILIKYLVLDLSPEIIISLSLTYD